LPPGAPSRYRLRRDDREGHLSTLEAVARAVSHIEPDGAELEAQLMSLFQRFVERSLWMRGLLPASEVTGGIPAH
jgi:DTW domain-containing protein YfiP